MRKLMKEIFISLFIVSFFGTAGLLSPGCATKPPVKYNETLKVKAKDSLACEERIQAAEEYNALGNAIQEAVRRMTESIDVVIKQVAYTPPDSAGKQYIDNVTTTSINKESKREEENWMEKKGTITGVVKRNSTTITNNASEVSAGRDIQAERKASITWYQSALIFLGCSTMAYIGYRWIRMKLP